MEKAPVFAALNLLVRHNTLQPLLQDRAVLKRIKVDRRNA
jgi:hypothetical protein